MPLVMTKPDPIKALTCQCGHRARQSADAWQYHRFVQCPYWKRQRDYGSTRADRKKEKGMQAMAVPA